MAALSVSPPAVTLSTRPPIADDHAGTFGYMASEQALGHAQPASDVFSLAKVLIEMLTGFKVSALLPNEALHLAEKIPPANSILASPKSHRTC